MLCPSLRTETGCDSCSFQHPTSIFEPSVQKHMTWSQLAEIRAYHAELVEDMIDEETGVLSAAWVLLYVYELLVHDRIGNANHRIWLMNEAEFYEVEDIVTAALSSSMDGNHVNLTPEGEWSPSSYLMDHEWLRRIDSKCLSR